MASSTRNVLGKVSLLLNVLLFLALLILGALYIRQGWLASSALDARPHGAIVTLQADTRIVSARAPTILLPQGTILQESTPQGAATLGKISERQYLLTIRTDNLEFTKNRPTEKAPGWEAPYTFAASPPAP